MKHKKNKTRLRRGTVLIVTIWIVLVLASLAIVFGQYVRVEAMAATNQVAQTTAEVIADGAIQYAFCMLSSEGSSGVIYAANPYEAIPAGNGFFWMMRPNLEDDRHYDFGLIDEAGKVNLNTASLEMLLKLPSMTAELANSIIDWRDGNQEISTGGAESEYYLLLPEPYYCKDAPLETVEEILLIKGGDLAGLYGEDSNRNGVLDTNENDAQASPPADNSNGKLDAGFFNYVTIHSAEPNVDAAGNARINVKDTANQSAVQELLRTIVGSDEATRVMQAFRPPRYDNLIELYYRTGMSYEDFDKIVDQLTTTDDEVLQGLINVNTASEKVLLCLPGLEQKDVDALLQERTKSSDDIASILWVTRALDQEKAVGIGSYITTRSYQSAADIMAASANGRAFCRYYVVIDQTQSPPQILFRQPLQHLGWSLDPEILENLRSGKRII